MVVNVKTTELPAGFKTVRIIRLGAFHGELDMN